MNFYNEFLKVVYYCKFKYLYRINSNNTDQYVSVLLSTISTQISVQLKMGKITVIKIDKTAIFYVY